ncbi:MAG: dTDP-4-dehydrorhamnose reductase [Cellvibrionaceae bacterium]
MVDDSCTPKLKVLVIGRDGQLGYSLAKTAPDDIELMLVGRGECDLSKIDNLPKVLDAFAPDVVINAAAYTAVDKAESEPELAELINSKAPRMIAGWCKDNDALMVQVSTDFVFDGSQSSPYAVDSKLSPLGLYGQTKAEGESVLTLCDQAYVVRTSWVYSEHGNNFVKTMLRLAKDRDQLGVVADQVGSPTYAGNLAAMIWSLVLEKPESKILHYSDAGVASWYDLAVSTFHLAKQKGLIDRIPLVTPIQTRDYPTPAKRPAYSVLDKSETWSQLPIEPECWQVALEKMLEQLENNH